MNLLFHFKQNRTRDNQAGYNFGTWIKNIFTQPVAVDFDRFVFVFVANPANGDPLTVALWDLWEAIKIQVLLSLVNL